MTVERGAATLKKRGRDFSNNLSDQTAADIDDCAAMVRSRRPERTSW